MSDGKIFIKKSFDEVNEKVTVEDVIEVIENMSAEEKEKSLNVLYKKYFSK